LGVIALFDVLASVEREDDKLDWRQFPKGQSRSLYSGLWLTPFEFLLFRDFFEPLDHYRAGRIFKIPVRVESPT